MDGPRATLFVSRHTALVLLVWILSDRESARYESIGLEKGLESTLSV